MSVSTSVKYADAHIFLLKIFHHEREQFSGYLQNAQKIKKETVSGRKRMHLFIKYRQKWRREDRMGEVHEEAENDYMLGMKYKEIAGKYGISLNTVKSWKQRYGWERGGGKKCAHKKRKKVCTQKKNAYTEEEKESPEDDDAIDRDELFCQYYAKSFNAVRSYMRVYHCSYQLSLIHI